MNRLAAALSLVAALFPAFATAGELRVEGAFPGTLALREHVVSAEVDNRLAVTRVKQVFVSTSDARLEGVYLFPVPPRASLSEFAMWVGGRKVTGALLEKARAREIYDSYKRVARDPALLEHVAQNLFHVKVFPIEPRSRVQIELAYREVLEYDGGFCRYVCPVATSASGDARAALFRLEVQVRSAVPIRSVVPEGAHALVENVSDSAATVRFEFEDWRPTEDLGVRYRLAGERTRAEWLAHRSDPAADGTFLLVLSPQEEGDAEPASKDVTFVLDVSGSMQGEKLEQARRALSHSIRALREGDRFEVIAFSDGVDRFAGGPVAATPENRGRALAFVESLAAAGGTALDGALFAAISSRVQGGRPHLVVLATDGKPTIGETNPRAIVDRMKRTLDPGARVYTFGIGTPADFDRELLETIARESGGSFESAGPTEDLEAKLGRFQEKIAFAVLSDLEIDWGGAGVRDVQPLRLPPLFRGTQLLVFGRYSGAGERTIALEGTRNGKRERIEVAIDLPEEDLSHPALPAAWAARKIDSLLYEMRLSGESGELRDEVVRLALEHHLATPYTSFLVLENEEEFRRWGLEAGKGEEERELDREERVEYPVQRNNAVESDHNETDSDVEPKYIEIGGEDEDRENKGEDMDALSDPPFKGKSASAAIGLGGGASGAFGGRFGGKENLVPSGAGRGTQSAVDMGLGWLAAHQDRSRGAWDSDDFQEQCRKNTCSGRGADGCDPAQTGLALLAFLGAGYTHQEGKHRETVKLGLKYLTEIQDEEGCFGPRTGNYMVNHAMATLAMAEAYGMTKSPLFKESAQDGIDFLVRAQNPGMGWGYRFEEGDSDTVVTGWAVMALKSARAAELSVPSDAFGGAKNWLDSATDDLYYRTGYAQKGDTGARPEGERAGDFSPAETCSAISIVCRVFMGAERGEPLLKGQGDLLSQSLPVWDTNGGPGGTSKIDFRYWYFGTLAMFQLGGDYWKTWNESMKGAIVFHQRKDGDERGSWDPIDAWGVEGGRVQATALNVLSLEIYYRYERVFK